jgi:1,4-alpha-glucan branching enzyme
LRLAAALTVLTPFTPIIFRGEEWGASTPWQFFTSHPEPELGAATAQGSIREFERMGWDVAAGWIRLDRPGISVTFDFAAETFSVHSGSPN